MRNVLNQVVGFIHNRALIHNLRIRSVDFNPPPFYSAMARLVSLISKFLIVVVIFGFFVIEKLRQFDAGSNATLSSIISLLEATQANKWTVVMIAVALSNMIQTALTSSQAFEIFLGHDLVWSSLEMKRLPSTDDLVLAFKLVGVEFLISQNL